MNSFLLILLEFEIDQVPHFSAAFELHRSPDFSLQKKYKQQGALLWRTHSKTFSA